MSTAVAIWHDRRRHHRPYGLRGATEKEQRMYERIKEDAQKSGRYGKRAKEVAARTVMKYHREPRDRRS